MSDERRKPCVHCGVRGGTAQVSPGVFKHIACATAAERLAFIKADPANRLIEELRGARGEIRAMVEEELLGLTRRAEAAEASLATYRDAAGKLADDLDSRAEDQREKARAEPIPAGAHGYNKAADAYRASALLARTALQSTQTPTRPNPHQPPPP